MPLPSEYATLLWGVFTIGYGILVEKYYVSKWTLVANLAGLIIILFTVDLPIAVAIGLIVFLIIGMVSFWAHLTPIFCLFGSKTYGSILFVFGLREIGQLGVFDWFARSLVSTLARTPEAIEFCSWLTTEFGLVLVGSLLIMFLVHIAGFMYVIITGIEEESFD